MSSKNRNNSRGPTANQGDDERMGASQESQMAPLLPLVDDETAPPSDMREPSFEQDRDDHDRLLDEREHGDLEFSDEERLELFRLTLFQNHLPPLPTIPDHHVCWLTTTNPRDSIAFRKRMGYKLIEAAEVPGFEHSTVKDGDYAGYIGVNEMVAAKLPLRLYAMYMTEAHHTQPLREEERLKNDFETIKEQVSKKTEVFEEPGNAALGRARRPRFEGLSG